TAPNAGPYTHTGTNSFIIGDNPVFVLDPGPADKAHFEALLEAVRGRKVEAVLLTHTHRDHSALAPRLARATGAPLWFEGPHRLSRQPRLFERLFVSRAGDWGLTPDRRLADGETIAAGGMTLEVV